MEKMEKMEKMERRQPACGEFYRHFKGKLYQVKMLARNSETQEWSVVYQEMYPPFQCWVRGLKEFMEPVDRGKYPGCPQEYRFERVKPEELGGCESREPAGREAAEAERWTGEEETLGKMGTGEHCHTEEGKASGKIGTGEHCHTEEGKAPGQTASGEKVSRELFIKAITSGQPERYLRGSMTADQVAERGFLELLDAETFRERRQIFMGLRNYLTPLLISNIAVALDIVLEEGNQEEQYESVLRCLEAFEHYEGGRLR